MQRNGLSHEEAGRLGQLKSRKTLDLLLEERKKSYLKNPKTCSRCGKAIPYEKRFENKYCSRSCAAKSNNELYPKRKKTSSVESNNSSAALFLRADKNEGSNAPVRKCPVCGRPVKKQNIFCSKACSSKNKTRLWEEEAVSSGHFPAGAHGEASRKKVKNYLESKFGHRCSICGITDWLGKPAPLVVDHIDGDTHNNDVSNFRLVCGNCDMQLPTYKSKNRPNRAWRRKYGESHGIPCKIPTKFIEFRCPVCGKEFTRRFNSIFYAGHRDQRLHACSRECSKKLLSSLRSKEYTDEQIEDMLVRNVIRILE